MPESRRARIALELAFLAVVTAILVTAGVRPGWVVVVMLVSWLLVALLEWVAWNDVPHWASGRPPRYHVPVRRLPPRPPTQELPRFSLYPQGRDDAPTWIAPPELREELLAAAATAAAESADDDWEPGWPDGHLQTAEADPWTATELPVAPEVEPIVEAVAVEPEPVVEPEPEPELEPEPEPTPVAPIAVPPVALARHRIDPFAEAPARRRPWHRAAEEPLSVELPSLPRHLIGGRR